MKTVAIKKIIDTAIPILGIMNSISNNRLIESIDDGLDNKKDEPKKSKVGEVISGILYLLLILFALYLHIQCKNRNIIGFIPAFLCPWIYLIYYAFTYQSCNYAVYPT